MQKFFVLLALLVMPLLTSAQEYIKDANWKAIQYDKRLSGGNYTNYIYLFDYLTQLGLTKQSEAPKGYEPFYISSYARHGSRFLTELWWYDSSIKTMKEAERKGVLTNEGKKLLKDLVRLRQLCPDSVKGYLTPIGAVEHKQIAARMVKNFPQIFDGKGEYFAQSSESKRCILSMKAEVGVIDSVTSCHVTQAHGWKGMQDRIAGKYDTPTIDSWRGKATSIHKDEMKRFVPYKRICSQFFKNNSWTSDSELQTFSRYLFEMAENMQSHDFGFDFYKYYTNEECDSMLIVKNRHWYRVFGSSMTTNNMTPLRAKWPVQDFIEGADSVVNRKDWHGANMRFGHDTTLMPLTCLLGLGTTTEHVSEKNIDELGDYFRCQEIFPMAGNIQIIFYRPTNGKGDILVKAMLCEVEVTLPGKPVTGKYYRWTDVRQHWLDRINEE